MSSYERYGRRYYLANRTKILTHCHAYREKHLNERRKKSRAYYWKHREERLRHCRKHHYAKKYGISILDLERMLQSQQGICPICNDKIGENYALDHDHQTGRIRAILCSNCNTGLGFFKESIALLGRALIYLPHPTTVQVSTAVSVEAK